jgi:choline kinase
MLEQGRNKGTTMAELHRTAVVLAAGFGSRLAAGVGGDQPKPLTIVAGTSLLMRSLHSLEFAGCQHVMLVAGFKAEQLEKAVRDEYSGPLKVSVVVNREFDLQNGVSVLSAREHLSETFLLTMADHVFDRSIMELAGAHRPPEGGATLLVDRKLDKIFDMDDATKVRSCGQNIAAIGKELDAYDCVDTGLFVCTHGLLNALEAYYRIHGDVSLSNGVQSLADESLMSILDIGDAFWQDIDTPEMLANAELILNCASSSASQK